MKRAFPLGCTLLLGVLAGCQQTWMLYGTSDASQSGAAGANGSDGGGRGGFSPSDASTDRECLPGPQIKATADVPQVVVALDRSTTMNETFGTNAETPMSLALSAIASELTYYGYYGGNHGVAASIDFAFIDFPDATAPAPSCNPAMGCCASDYTTNYTTFQAQANACNASGPSQCSDTTHRPTTAALNEAAVYFMSATSANTDRYGERYVLLITNSDPDPACASDVSAACTDAIAAVGTLSGIGATTEVIDMSSGSSCLKDLASAQRVSPTPYYQTMTPPTDVGDVIPMVMKNEIAPDGCRFTLATQPTSTQITVWLNGTKYQPDPGMTGDSWYWDGGTRVYLHGALCDEYLYSTSNMFEQLTVYDGCGPSHFGQTP